MDEILDEILGLISDLADELPDEDVLTLYDSLLAEIEERKSILIENLT